MKDFTFKFIITVPAKWIKTARQFVINIYTEQKAYATVFKSDWIMKADMLNFLAVSSYTLYGVRAVVLQNTLISSAPVWSFGNSDTFRCHHSPSK